MVKTPKYPISAEPEPEPPPKPPPELYSYPSFKFRARGPRPTGKRGCRASAGLSASLSHRPCTPPTKHEARRLI